MGIVAADVSAARSFSESTLNRDQFVVLALRMAHTWLLIEKPD